MNRIEVKNKTVQRKIQKKLYRLNKMFLKSKEKVAYYYEDIKTNIVFSFNENICFYAASTIKILVSLYLFEQARLGDIKLDQTILITKEDLKQGSGIIKNQVNDTSYTIHELLYYTLKESDNTAYLKLVELVGHNNLISYGKSLGALHCLEGKDEFGIISCYDLKKYFQAIFSFIQIEDEFGISYHEACLILEENPFYLFVLTQKNEKKEKNKFIHKTAHQLLKIHLELKRGLR